MASVAFTACPTRAISCCDAKIVLNPSQKTGWSSTMRIRIGLDDTIPDRPRSTIFTDVYMLWLASQRGKSLNHNCNAKLAIQPSSRHDYWRSTFLLPGEKSSGIPVSIEVAATAGFIHSHFKWIARRSAVSDTPFFSQMSEERLWDRALHIEMIQPEF